jgi:hypothetical protein
MGGTLSPRRRRGRAVGWLVLLLMLLLYIIHFFITHRPGRPHYAMQVKQRAQFHSLEAALELFGSEFGVYPPSDANNAAGQPYGGAMKLAEAMMGQDLLGFHSDSAFRADGLDPNTLMPLYPNGTPSTQNLKARGGPYLPPQSANAFRLADVYGKPNTGPFSETTLVLCDSFVRERPSGRKTGMPILYYKANRSGTAHDVNDPDNPQNIYRYRDNQALIALGVPGEPNTPHPLADPKRFYMNTQNHHVWSPCPYRQDCYILISAGYDGLYGTVDDICNCQWRYRKH